MVANKQFFQIATPNNKNRLRATPRAANNPLSHALKKEPHKHTSCSDPTTTTTATPKQTNKQTNPATIIINNIKRRFLPPGKKERKKKRNAHYRFMYRRPLIGLFLLLCFGGERERFYRLILG